MASNPWKFKDFKFMRDSSYEVRIILTKKDIRGGFDLGTITREHFLIVKDIDFSNKNKYYWKKIFMDICNSGKKWEVVIPYKNAMKIIKRIRLERYYHRLPKFKTWDERYGWAISDWAMEIIEEEVEDLCKDNFRLAKIGDRKAIKRYKEQLGHGCCGYFDIIRRCPFDWFRKYKIGCNYGH